MRFGVVGALPASVAAAAAAASAHISALHVVGSVEEIVVAARRSSVKRCSAGHAQGTLLNWAKK